MKTIIICEDCGTCCSKDDIQTKLESTANTQVLRTHCMDLCPKGKISSIILDSNKVNDFKITPLTIEEIQSLL